MAKRIRPTNRPSKVPVSADAEVVLAPRPALQWQGLPTTANDGPPPPSPFAAPSQPLKKKVPVSLTMWAIGLGINPDVFQDEMLNTYINEKDGVDSYRELRTLLLGGKYFGKEQDSKVFWNEEKQFELEFIYLVEQG